MLHLLETTQNRVHLSNDFLAPYRRAVDPFKSLLARSTYLTKYSRWGETWTDTILRSVLGNVSQDPRVTEDEAKQLFHLFWTAQMLPPGRGLWTGGVEGISTEARYNCAGVELRTIDDWCWVADHLMLGCGVGISLLRIDSFPPVAEGDAKFGVYCSDGHENFDEVKPEGPQYLNGTTPLYRCEDSRQGWVKALRLTLEAAWEGRSLIIDVSGVRPRGALIKTFGGVACGPGPLVNLLRAAWSLVRGAKGRKLKSIEALDISNHIGLCIKSGNVRRSAIILLGSPDDQEFRNAKKDSSAILSHRHTSNNTIVFEDERTIRDFDWDSLIEDNAQFGEPGIYNLFKARQTDSDIVTINPCGEIGLENRGFCCLAELFPAQFQTGTEAAHALKLLTRYALRQRLSPLADPIAEAVRVKNMRIGVALGGVCDFDWTPEVLQGWKGIVDKAAYEYADFLGVSRPVATTTLKPSGTISLLNGSAPGAHAQHSPFYIRNVRIAKNDKMASVLMEAGVPFEDCTYDTGKNTWVFSFPTAAPNPKLTKKNETLRQQFERQRDLQAYWADNAVSMTINFDPETERKEAADLMREFVPQLKSTSLLPSSHGYEQAPYIEIDEDRYRSMYAQIQHDHKLAKVGDLDSLQLDECSGGACPIR